MNQMKASGAINRTHLKYGMPLAARTPIKTPDVGLMQLATPSPSMTAYTATCLVICMRSARGAKIGMNTTDSPEPEEIKK